jgi:hypothetical protein
MLLAEIRPSDEEDFDDYAIPVTKDYDWSQNANNYTKEELDQFPQWIQNEKIKANDHETEDAIQSVNFSQLNKMQKFCYALVNKFIKSNKQLLLIINGTAGTGKSFTISAISNLIGKKLKRCAPTAKAAFIIKGQTIHNIFSITPTKNEREVLLDLKGEKLQLLQQRFIDISHIIIDEYSMVSQALLAQIDKRLRQATGNNDYFGGLSIILVGDPGQLLPVGGTPLYLYPPKNGLSAHGLLCYQQFNHAIKLEQVERQKNNENDHYQGYFID